jgi:hypothetical protein
MKINYTVMHLEIPLKQKLNSSSLEESVKIIEKEGFEFQIENINWPQIYNYKPSTVVKIARNTDSVFILFKVDENDLRVVHEKDNSPVNEDSCVEFFTKKIESDYYYNFEFNCAGVCKAARHYKDRHNAIDFTDEQLKKIKRLSGISTRGIEKSDEGYKWELLVKIPFELFGIDKDNLPEKISGNFYKCGDKTKEPHYVTWAPVLTEKPDFHRPEFFRDIFLL